MKVYRTHIFSIGYNENLGKDKYVGEILVKKTLLGIEELKTGWPIRTASIDEINCRHSDSFMRGQVYKEFGYDLVAIKEDLEEYNVVSEENKINKYLVKFKDSNVCKIFKKMNLIPEEEIITETKVLLRK